MSNDESLATKAEIPSVMYACSNRSGGYLHGHRANYCHGSGHPIIHHKVRFGLPHQYRDGVAGIEPPVPKGKFYWQHEVSVQLSSVSCDVSWQHCSLIGGKVGEARNGTHLWETSYREAEFHCTLRHVFCVTMPAIKVECEPSGSSRNPHVDLENIKPITGEKQS
jgi:hypothetical protein